MESVLRVLLPQLLPWQRPLQAWPPRPGEPGERSSARPGLQSPPRRRWAGRPCEAAGGLWAFFLARSPFAVLVEMLFVFSLLPSRPHPPRAQLGMVPQQSQTVVNNQAAGVVSNKSAFPPRGCAFWYLWKPMDAEMILFRVFS